MTTQNEGKKTFEDFIELLEKLESKLGYMAYQYQSKAYFASRCAIEDGRNYSHQIWKTTEDIKTEPFLCANSINELYFLLADCEKKEFLKNKQKIEEEIKCIQDNLKDKINALKKLKQ